MEELFRQSECKCECEWAKGEARGRSGETHLSLRTEAGRAGNGGGNDRHRRYRVDPYIDAMKCIHMFN